MKRAAIVIACAIVFSAIVVPALLRLPPVGGYRGPYGDAVRSPSIAQRHTSNVVAAVAYDIRGFDTLGEELILLTAVLGVTLLLRTRGERHREQRGIDRAIEHARDKDATEPAVRHASANILAIGVMFGWYMTLHATTSPGGGFQGGAVIASAVALVYLAYGYRTWSPMLRERLLDIGEAAGIGTFIVCAAVPLVLGTALVFNWMPFGTLGKLGSGGTMFVMNVGIALAVAAGFSAICDAMLFELHEAQDVMNPRRREQHEGPDGEDER